MSASQVDTCLSYFVVEVRKTDGSLYPRSSLYSILCGIWRYLGEKGKMGMNFLENKDERFYKFRKVFDVRLKQLRSIGISTFLRQAKPITPRKKETLWLAGELGSHSAQFLLSSVFYFNCKLFGLQARDEHRNLQCQQITLGKEENGPYIEFQGRASKNIHGGINHRKIRSKHIKHYCSNSGARNVYDIYQTYMKAVGNEGNFYKRPLSGNGIRFSQQTIGVNKLGSIIKNMCAKANILDYFTNHLGKRTCATSLYQAGINDLEICRRTGHRGNAVNLYKVQSVQQMKQVSAILDPPLPVNSIPKRAPLPVASSALPSLPIDLSRTSIKCDKENKKNNLPPLSSGVMYSNCVFNINYNK